MSADNSVLLDNELLLGLRDMQPSFQLLKRPLLTELFLCFSCDKPCFISTKDDETEAQMA